MHPQKNTDKTRHLLRVKSWFYPESLADTSKYNHSKYTCNSSNEWFIGSIARILALHAHKKQAHSGSNFIFHFQFFIENGRTQALVRAPTRDAYNLYSVNFLYYWFHTIGKYVQNYRYRLSTDMTNIGRYRYQLSVNHYNLEYESLKKSHASPRSRELKIYDATPRRQNNNLWS